MEFKGTKGNWGLYQEKKQKVGQNYSIMNITSDSKAEWGTDIASVWNDEPIKDEAYHNALLISKAPEMLEMLKVVSYGLSQMYRHEEDSVIFDLIDAEKLDKLIKEATEL